MISPELLDRVRSLSLSKALCIASYGESVAAYRYRVLTDKVKSKILQVSFAEMADEEQGHHVALQEVMRVHFEGADFVLSEEDKDLVIVGQRMIEVTNATSTRRAIELICQSERRTGRFYAALHQTCSITELKPFLHEMAEECFDHAHRLETLTDKLDG